MEDVEDYSQDAYLNDDNRDSPVIIMDRSTFAEQLMQAAELGNVEKLRELFDEDDDEDDNGHVVATSNQIEKALRRAAEHAQLEACRFLFLYREPSYDIYMHRSNPMLLDPIDEQLDAAVEANDLVYLCELLLLEDEFGDDAAKDDDIESALRMAILYENRLSAFRLLCKRLTPSLKEKYTADTMLRPLLHQAVNEGRIEIVSLCVQDEEYKTLFNINQEDEHGQRPLDRAIDTEYDSNPEICRLLVENGAHLQVAGHDRIQPLEDAVSEGNAAAVQILLEYGADPNFNRSRPANEEETYHNQRWNQNPRYTDTAIENGATEILSPLLQYGAYVGNGKAVDGTSLNELLRNTELDREHKIPVCQLLVENATPDNDIAVFLQSSLEKELKEANMEGCEILLLSGIQPSSRALYYAIQNGNEPLCRLLVEHGSDPFEEEAFELNDEHAGERHHHHHHIAAPSPFHAASFQEDVTILRFFLKLWYERFSSSDGKDMNGDCPIHILCRHQRVSVQAIMLLVEEHQANVSMVANGEEDQGRLPFHLAVMSGAKLDVIYYLLKHFPDAIKNRNNASVNPLPLLSTVNSAGDSGGTDSDDDGKIRGRNLLEMYVPPSKVAKTTHSFATPNATMEDVKDYSQPALKKTRHHAGGVDGDDGPDGIDASLPTRQDDVDTTDTNSSPTTTTASSSATTLFQESNRCIETLSGNIQELIDQGGRRQAALLINQQQAAMFRLRRSLLSSSLQQASATNTKPALKKTHHHAGGVDGDDGPDGIDASLPTRQEDVDTTGTNNSPTTTTASSSATTLFQESNRCIETLSGNIQELIDQGDHRQAALLINQQHAAMFRLRRSLLSSSLQQLHRSYGV